MEKSLVQAFDLTGKKAIVTGVGAFEGIGRYLAEGLLEAGAEVVMINRSDRMFKVRDTLLTSAAEEVVRGLNGEKLKHPFNGISYAKN